MRLTQPCFIRRNTKELRKYLEKSLGYKCMNTGGCTLDAHNYDGKGTHRTIEEGKLIITSPPHYYGVCYSMDRVVSLNRVDCGVNKDLFKAITALRNNSDRNQWFTDGNKWHLCNFVDITTEYCMGDTPFSSQNYHKATVEELINHFK